VAAEPVPRYSSRPFPAYAYVPGRHPHPRRDPEGHSYGRPEPTPAACTAAHWPTSEEFLYAVDLYNFGYWWECHEVFEGLWKAVGPKTELGSFFQALVDLAAGNLKYRMENSASASKLWKFSLSRLERLPSSLMGLDIHALASELRTRLSDSPASPVLLRLQSQMLRSTGRDR
jgi:predicted metal-dependent hydrolase